MRPFVAMYRSVMCGTDQTLSLDLMFKIAQEYRAGRRGEKLRGVET